MITQESLKDRIATQIAALKVSASNAEYHLDDSEFFYKLSQNVKGIAHDIDIIHFGYYVVIIDNVHYPIGFMTRAEAFEYIENEDKLNATYYGDCTIKEVSKEVYDKYFDLIQLDELYDHIDNLRYILNDAILDTFITDLKTKIKQLRRDIGFKTRWEDSARIHH